MNDNKDRGGVGFYSIILMYVSIAVCGSNFNVFTNVVYKLLKVIFIV